MTDDRADGPTFALDDICWIDFETRSETPIKAGTYRYATEADAIVLAYAIGDAPVHTIWLRDFTRSLSWGDLPPELVLFYERACCGEAVFAAWNAGFDRAVWNYATAGFSELKPHHIIDVMTQATASGLPPDLNYAARFSGSTHKMSAGKSLIALFCLPGATATPQTHPDEWQAFLSYAGGDIVAMRDIFRRTRQLPLAEWQEYWAMEAINSRGIAVDLHMVQTAARLAEEDRYRSAKDLMMLTGLAVSTVDQVKKMTEWLLDRLPPQGRDIILKREEEIDEDQVITRPAKYSLTRKQVERLLALSINDPTLADPVRVLQLRLYGGSKTPAKFQRILDGHVDGVLYGQYVFSGAAQTGRACVDEDTRIDTPIRPRRIVDLDEGDLVTGGSGEPRKVLAKIYKGRAPMYALAGPRAAFVIATADHRIMTVAGWKRIDDCFEKTADGRFVLRGDCTPVSLRSMFHAGDRFASQDAQAETWSLILMGERDVWDISVERDESYIAQGLIHHNSSKGVQIHNLARDTLPYEHDAVEALLAGTDYDAFAALGDTSPVARKLSLLIRPAFVPTKATNVFVWSDWSQIEARVLPWLCDHLAGARSRLDIFREVDADPDLPDLYTRTAADLAQVPHFQVTKGMRQHGKVAELALGYGGGKGALQAMAAQYGLHLDDTEAQDLVDAWRQANPWAGQFARQLWDTMETARQITGALVPCGRVGFIYLPEYLGGSLLCRLPSGRCLTYRALRREMVDEKDDDGKVVKSSLQWTYARGHGRQKLWPGIFVENVTQAVAADILRGTLVRLEGTLAVRLHTHDEVLVECADGIAEEVSSALRYAMQLGFDWSAGLPLMSTETIAPYYSKRA